MDPWKIELVVVRDAAMGGGERRALSRDTQRGLFHRVRQGVHVDKAAWDGATGWKGALARHVVAMRAYAAVAPRPPVFSHWSAAVLHDLPILLPRLDRVHTTVEDVRERGLDGVAGHVFALRTEEVVQIAGLLATGRARTVIDVAGASPFDAGVAIADAALFRGMPRGLLEAAVDLAGPRRALRRITDVVGFAHPGAESVGESQTRWSMFRLGIAPQELQHWVLDGGRRIARVDTWDERRRIACETDGDVKYLDSEMAPDGAGAAVIREKRREDQLRPLVAGLARFGYADACSPTRLRPILTRVGLLPEQIRPTLADYSAVARAARSSRLMSP